MGHHHAAPDRGNRRLTQEKEETIMTDPTRRFALGDRVTTAEFGTMTLVVTELFTGDNGFCVTCHCDPVDPDHYDGTLCCPGPFYSTAFLDSGGVQNDPAMYAEHELTPA